MGNHKYFLLKMENYRCDVDLSNRRKKISFAFNLMLMKKTNIKFEKLLMYQINMSQKYTPDSLISVSKEIIFNKYSQNVFKNDNSFVEFLPPRASKNFYTTETNTVNGQQKGVQ